MYAPWCLSPKDEKMGKGNMLYVLFSILSALLVASASAEWSILSLGRKNLNGRSLKNYCESWRINVELNNIRDFDVVPEECATFIGKYMTSEQYRADSERTIEECSLYLSRCCNLKGDGRDAWVFDIDDTLLSTVPYYKKHNYGGEMLNLTSLEGWMMEGKAPALKHTLKLFKEVKGKGLKIFLVSARRECLRSATIDNLIRVGYQGWTSLILRDAANENKNVQDYKADVRMRLTNQGYRVHAILGDQWSSIKGLPKAKRTFKLPNSLYYTS